jgi:hypothetical protein
MIELKHDRLVFSFPEVHPKATLSIDFQRTLRIPDDGKTHHLPPGLGSFPLRHVDDFAERVSSAWLQRGGVMLPMYQAEALWICFGGGGGMFDSSGYPFAVKIATGKINAVTGDAWKPGLTRKPQDYVVSPTQPWLDGYCVEKGTIRQFVAMPLGADYTAEEQLTGEAQHGGVQLLVYPMKREAYERMLARRKKADSWSSEEGEPVVACMSRAMDMGLAPGGRMRQEIYDDPHKLADWDTEHASRCFVHIANSLVWQSITGGLPPSPPPTAKHYTRAGLPWFDYYAEGQTAVDGSEKLAGMKSVKEVGEAKGDVPLPENESVTPENVVTLRAKLAQDQVREGAF